MLCAEYSLCRCIGGVRLSKGRLHGAVRHCKALKACITAARSAHLIRQDKGINFLLGQVIQVAQHALHCYRPAMQTTLKYHCALTAISQYLRTNLSGTTDSISIISTVCSALM